MSVPQRATMRLLSQRLLRLQRSTGQNLYTQARQASRYSQPSRRNAADELPTIPASFIGGATIIDSRVSSNLDQHISREPLEAARLESAKRRRNNAAYGLILSTIGVGCCVYYTSILDDQKGHSLDASKADNERFQGKEVHVIGVGEGKRIVAEDTAGALDLVETGTSSVPHFPKLIYLPTATESTQDPHAMARPNTQANPGNKADLEEYSLVGLGIRAVSFLNIQVYVVGLYVRTADITGLQARLIHHINPTASTLIPSEKEDLKAQLLDADGSRAIWDELLQSPGMKTAWRIAPTRNTDFMHLRDGWITGINKRTAEAKKLNGNVPSEYDREDFGQSIRSFMSIFKGGKAPKGSVMVLSRSAVGGLDVFFQAKPEANGNEQETQLLGSIGDERISKLIWMNYLAGSRVSSEAARQGVADGCVALASRPVGSVETMVA